MKEIKPYNYSIGAVMLRPCPGCDNRGFVNVGHHTAPDILIPCPHPDHDMKEDDDG
jgi:hypothetical protein